MKQYIIKVANGPSLLAFNKREASFEPGNTPYGGDVEVSHQEHPVRTS